MLKRTFFFAALLSLFYALCFSAPALAAPVLDVMHRTEAFLYDGKVVPEAWAPRFSRVALEVSDIADDASSGSLTLSDSSYTFGTQKEFHDEAGTAVNGASKTFTLYNEGDYFSVRETAGHEAAYFWGDADTGFSEKNFSFEVDGTTYSGKMPVITKFGDLAAKYGPNVEFVIDKGIIKAVKWGFSGTDSRSVYVNRIRLYTDERDGIDNRIRKMYPGTEQTWDLGDKALPYTLDTRVELTFSDGRTGENNNGTASVSYRWIFRPADLFVQHASRAALYDYKTDYEHTKPFYASTWIGYAVNSRKSDAGKLTFKNSAYSYGVYDELVLDKGTDIAEGDPDVTFDLRYRDRNELLARTESGETIYFWNRADDGFSDKNFDVGLGSGKVMTGKFPTMRSTAKQVEQCVPYVECVLNDAKTAITVVKWRFVNPTAPEVALTAGPNVPVNWLYHIRLRRHSDEGFVQITDGDRVFADGEKMEGTVTLSEPFPVDDFDRVQVRFFDTHTYRGTYAFVRYEWAFLNKGPKVVVSDEDPNPTLLLPDTEDVEKASVALSTDLGRFVRTEPVKPANVSTSAREIVDGGGAVDASSVASAIGVSQDIEAGGAVVVATGLPFPSAATSPNGTALPELTSEEDMYKKWSVNKYFEDGTVFDILKRYRDKSIFRYYDGTAILDATVVIVDDSAADISDPDCAKLGSGGKYGVMLKTHGTTNYLYIFDGEKNGHAVDPIALEAARSEGGSSSSGVGCGVGVGGPVLLSLLGVAVIFRKVR